MTFDGAFQGPSVKSTQLLQRGSLLLLALPVSMLLAFRVHNDMALGVVLALGTVVVPAAYVMARRTVEKGRQRAIEDRLMMHTRAYLKGQAPARGFRSTVACKGPAEESEIEILARVIDGRKLPRQDFRRSADMASLLPFGYPVVFDALPRRYAVRSSYERRFADLATKLPEPVYQPLTQLTPNSAFG